MDNDLSSSWAVDHFLTIIDKFSTEIWFLLTQFWVWLTVLSSVKQNNPDRYLVLFSNGFRSASWNSRGYWMFIKEWRRECEHGFQSLQLLVDANDINRFSYSKSCCIWLKILRSKACLKKSSSPYKVQRYSNATRYLCIIKSASFILLLSAYSRSRLAKVCGDNISIAS